MEINKEKLLAIYSNEETITAAAKKYAQQEGINYDDNIRRRCSLIINKEVDPDLENMTSTETNQYEKNTSDSFMPSAWDSSLERFLSIEEYCDKYGLPKDAVRSSKLVSHNSSHMVYNIAFFSPEEEVVLDIEKHLDEIVSKHILPVEYKVPQNTKSNVITNVTYTDTHVGLEPNKEGNSLYGGKWNSTELFKRLEVLVDKTVKISQLHDSNILFIRDLGDFADGLNGETVRGGHELPQNMSNVEVFDEGLSFKMLMIDKFIKSGQYKEIICENVCNSNHGGDFDYFINSAFKKIVETKYSNVKVNNHRKFISHYTVGDHCFILSHGKDSHTLKFGFRPILDPKAMEKIDNYIKGNNLYQQYKYFTFIKGDSHLQLFDMSTSQDFNYFNYPAFSPSSQWVQNNFKQGFSAFVVETFRPDEEEIDIYYKKFEWQK